MKCPACGHLSRGRRENCPVCGASTRAGAPQTAPAAARQLLLDLEPRGASAPRDGKTGEPARREPPLEAVDLQILEIREEDLDAARAPGARPRGRGAAGADLPPGDIPALREAGEAPAPGHGGGEPIIDRDDEVPESFWAPEAAGLGRRAAALLVDQALLAGIGGLFLVATALALDTPTLGASGLLSARGVRALLPPFALLAALVSLEYHVFFHARSGMTPGKALAGLEVRTRRGLVPSPGRAALRWLAAALGVACAGAGVVWALFEPRRLGWADLLSDTVIAERRRLPPEAPDGVDNPGGRGYHSSAVQGRDSSAGRATD